MSRYAKIYPKMWRNNEFRDLNEDGRSIFLYLLTSPHLNMVGFYYLPIGYISDDIQWKSERVSKGLRNCIERGFIKYDSITSVVLILNYLKFSPIENPNQAKGAIKNLFDMPHTVLFKDFEECIKKYAEPFQKGFETLWEAYAKPVTVTVTVPVTVTENTSSPDGSVWENKPFKVDVEMFDCFWRAYPKKKSKPDAIKAWNKLKIDNLLYKLIMNKLEDAKKSHDWTKENGQFIPYPAKWLNKKMWEDEYDTAIEQVPAGWNGIKQWANREGVEIG